MSIILFDDKRSGLYPISFTRPCADIRVGILRIQEKWEHFLSLPSGFQTVDYLSEKFNKQNLEASLWINGRLLPDTELIAAIKNLKDNQALIKDTETLAVKSKDELDLSDSTRYQHIEYQPDIVILQNVYDIFELNDYALRLDYKLLTKGKKSAGLSKSNTVAGNDVFVEEGAIVEGAYLNSTTGPIYIAKGAEVMEGSLIRGPFYLGEGSAVKMGAKIYGATTVGPHSKVGGEINNVVFQGYSNKGHDGFLGNSVIGEWCNLGADTNSSNLKNNYAEVKVWNYNSRRFANTGLQFCGLIMGDHSKCGINTMFNTGTMVGVSANIFGAGFPRNFVPSFTWGGSTGFATYALNKAFDTANRVMMRRGISLEEQDKNILKHIFEESSEFRIWEKKTSSI